MKTNKSMKRKKAFNKNACNTGNNSPIYNELLKTSKQIK
jgi:hypothetical protein